MLYATARVEGGVVLPVVTDVARETGISRKTLARWWEGRDRSKDARMCAASSRGQAKAAEEGAAAWAHRTWRNLAAIVDNLSDPALYAKGGKFEALDADKVARAVKLVAETIPAIDRALGDSSDTVTPGERMQRARLSARRAGLLKATE